MLCFNACVCCPHSVLYPESNQFIFKKKKIKKDRHCIPVLYQSSRSLCDTISLQRLDGSFMCAPLLLMCRLSSASLTVPYFPFCLKKRKASLQQATSLIYPFWDLPCDSGDFFLIFLFIGMESSGRTARTLSMPFTQGPNINLNDKERGLQIDQLLSFLVIFILSLKNVQDLNDQVADPFGQR